MKRHVLKRYRSGPLSRPATPALVLSDRKGYPGSKGQAGTFQRIIGQMRPHRVYVEACCGSGKVFTEKMPAENSILIDTNAAALATVGVTAGAAVRKLVGDAVSLLPELLAWLPADSVIYVDAPYILETRQGRLYYGEHEPERRDPEWHAKLLTILRTARCDVLVSHYPHELYSSQLQAWRCIEYDAMTRGGKRRECLWCNFPEPVELHDWRFAGFNFRERYHMRRFVDRWLARVDKMPPRRAGYIRQELAKHLEQRRRRRHDPSTDPATPPLVMTPAR